MTALGPRSSVCALVPHFRCELWLAQALESLLEQTRPPDAIVVIDDGSDEPPVDVVREFPDVTLLAAADNGGPYRLVQAVIDRTRFDAYLFQDADDWSAPDRVAALLDEAAHSGAELVGSHEVRVLVDEGDVVPVTYPLDVNRVLRDRPTAFPLLHPTSLVGRALVERLGGFATGMRFSGDAELLRRAAHVARVVNVDHFGYFRRKRRGSLTLGSDTALGSPARLAVQEGLAERARTNAERVAAGLAPDVAPWRTAAPPELRHIMGPVPDEARSRSPRRPPSGSASRAGPPVFVLGAPRSGHTLLAWALGQHPSLGLLPDSRWLARAAADVEGRAGEEAAPPPAGFREALADGLRSVATGGGRRLLATGSDLVPVAHALRSLFPDARFLHVVRDADDATGALRQAPTADGTYYTPEASWRTWLATTEAGLAVERALGADAVLRVHYDELVASPEQAVRRCLAFLGEDHRSACVRPLTDLTVAIPPDETGAPDGLVARARRVSRSLAHASVPRSPDADARRRLAERFRREWLEQRETGETLVERVRALVNGSVPEATTVAVVSRGDPRLVDLDGRTGWHVPQVDGGLYAGHHPADGDEAVEHVERLRIRGAEYLVVPATSLWWLSYYGELRDRLADAATLVSFHEDAGAVFRLAIAPVDVTDGAPAPPRFVATPSLQPTRTP